MYCTIRLFQGEVKDIRKTCLKSSCKDFEKLKEEVEMIMNQFMSETFSFEEYEFPALEFIVSRYYFTFPRVKLESKLN